MMASTGSTSGQTDADFDAGTVFTATGQDWDELTDLLKEAPEERVVVNMAPSTRPPTACCADPRARG